MAVLPLGYANALHTPQSLYVAVDGLRVVAFSD